MNFASLTPFDWLLAAILVISTVRAFLRGFLLEVVSVISLIAGILLASWYYADFALTLATWLKPFTTLALATADILAFLLILSVTMIAGGIAGKFLRSSASAIGLGLVDRFLGAGFGLGRGFLLGVAGMMLLTAFDPTTRLTAKSQLFPYFLAGARGVSFVVPAGLQQQLAEGADRIKHNQPVWIKPSE